MYQFDLPPCNFLRWPVTILALLIAITTQHALSPAHAQPAVPDLSNYGGLYAGLGISDVIAQAVAGDVLAQHQLGNRLAHGRGIARNHSAAAYWHSLAAKRGFPGSPSLDVLPIVPFHALSDAMGTFSSPPNAQLSVSILENSLLATVDATNSTSSANLTRYIWSVVSESGTQVDVALGNTASSQIALPENGVYYVTLTILDSTGQIGHTTEKLDLSAPLLPELPLAPQLLAPAASATVEPDATVVFEWSQAADTNTYQFELLNTASDSTEPVVAALVPVASCLDAVCAVSVVFDFELYGSLTWQVRAVNDTGASDWSASELMAQAPKPAIAVNISPEPGTNLNQNDTVTFIWQEDPTVDTYDFHIYNRSNTAVLFNPVTGMLPEDVCAESLCSIDVLLDLPVNNSHAWRVKASNAGGIADFSRSTFNIVEPITEPPAAPVLTTPLAAGYVETGTTATFSWLPASLATSYEFEILNGTTPVQDSLPASSCSTDTCNLSIALSLPTDTDIAWRVRSINPIDSSAWTDGTFYTIEAATEAPAVAVHLTPASGADIVENTIATFIWVHDPKVTVYDFRLFNNEPGLDRGPLPDIADLNPRDICNDGICSIDTLVNLPLYTDHAWRVRANNSQGSSNWSRRTFNAVELVTDPPAAPTAVSPLPAAKLETDTSITFRWAASDTASRYQLQLLDTTDETLDTPSAFVPASNCTNDACSVSVALDLPPGNTYQWRVLAENAAGVSDWVSTNIQIIAKATTVPPLPVLLLPEAGALVSKDDPTTFAWSRDVHAVTYEFYFYDALTRESSTTIADLNVDEICDDTLCAMSVPVDLSVAKGHIWRVRGRNSLGASNWSPSTIEVVDSITSPPGGFELTSPLPTAELEETLDVTFLWTRAANATSFELAFVDGTDTTAEPQILPVNASVCDVDFCSYTTAPLLPLSDLHLWQVRAFNELGQTDWVSSPFALVGEPVELLDAPVIVAPLAGTAIMTGETVAFQWQQNEDALSYEFYLTDALDGAQALSDNLLPAEYCVDSLCSLSVLVELTPSTAHSWHVRARHETADSAWAVTTFSVVSDANAPTAAFSIDGGQLSTTGIAPLTLSFNPSASTDESAIVSYAWDFGDESAVITSDTAEIVAHTFTEFGSYTVALTVTNDSGLTNTVTATVTVLDPATTVSSVDASRLLAQASFGPTRSDIVAVQTLGIEGWLNEQFTLQGPPHLDYLSVNPNYSDRTVRHEIWWSDVVRGEDQLRQRVAFALSQILVVSDVGYTLANSQDGITNYYDMLRDNAFGNYRELLEQVTLSPVMGIYLSMLQNAKGDTITSTRPDENFAREVLQLFTIGLHELNIDGSTDGTPVFDQDQIEAFARVFTGWNYADAGRWDRTLYTGADMINAMRPFESFHDTGSKQLLNDAIAPAGLLAREDLEFALDNIFNHANVGPFLAKQLIQRLVTSNPTPGYVQRVAQAFNDDGYGERGNLEAVVRAILLDTEARSTTSSAAYGKLREPVLRLSHLWRAFNVQPGSQSSARQEFNTGSPQLYNLEQSTGQAVLRSPSVFNFFQPSFSPAGPVADQNLVSPEFELFTESNELATSNRIGRQIQDGYLGNPQSSARATAYLDFTYELSLAANPSDLIDHLDVLLLSGNLSDTSRTFLIGHLEGLPDTETGLSQRVRDAVTLIMASPDYLVQM